MPRPASSLAIGAAVLLLAACPEAAAQCAMCKEALESGTPAAANLGRGMGWTIALLLGTFFSLAGGFVYLVVRHGRTTPVPPPPPPQPDRTTTDIPPPPPQAEG